MLFAINISKQNGVDKYKDAGFDSVTVETLSGGGGGGKGGGLSGGAVAGIVIAVLLVIIAVLATAAFIL